MLKFQDNYSIQIENMEDLILIWLCHNKWLIFNEK